MKASIPPCSAARIAMLYGNLLLLSVLIVGCRKAAPELEAWPVQGTVSDPQGNPLTGGAIRLMTEEDAYLNTSGTIQPDGSFSIHSNRRGHKYEGAVARDYRVMVIYDVQGKNGHSYPANYELPESFTVQPEDNLLEIAINR